MRSGNGKAQGPTVITGGAGFIGANLADRLAQAGEQVIILDNLSRPDVARNVASLERRHGERIELVLADVRDAEAVLRAVRGAGHVYHFAAQVAVTTSLLAPREDLEINVGGTLNVLEAIRNAAPEAALLFTSTSKVYGALCDLEPHEGRLRTEPAEGHMREHGIAETRRLDFHSPYGCSKGAADQYVLDYARSFGLRAVVFRMSCIYGPRQLGTEDQGWVAHFFRCALRGRPLTIYGDGRQVRDLLYVGDLVDAMMLAMRNIERVRGQAFNLGGGPENTASLLEMIEMIGKLCGKRPELERALPRTGDPRWYVSDTSRFSSATGWTARVPLREGLVRLLDWLLELEGEDRQLEVAQ